MSQNEYDKNDSLFNKFSNKNLTIENETLLFSMIPWEIVKNGNVIDFGCGNGWFCREMIEKGVNQIIGVDISEKLIKKAIELNKDNNEKSKYYVTDLDNFQLNETPFNSLIGSFDFAFSSYLTHYLSDLESFFKKVYNLLKSNNNNGSSFIFFAEHPMRTSTKCIENKFISHKFEGDENSKMVWPISNYSEEGKRVTKWAGSNGIVKYHYTIETYVNTLIKVGFKIDYIGELNLVEKQLQLCNSGDITIEANSPFTLFIKVIKN
ncbi:hypothetical protein DDB_G0293670 [Dictyostelium discoideum AX4]|uniref:Uncharacterized protein n=1 Tax=Dictyostelium discoideum TaxID=44689 RepID=Q54BE2_DICDI|nr:hypothetical protein DDB_G0293670 [Dictyostelium discoideum AX4]EAL60647.1 hypothetical protein DDB_G0293670 [Dictyostelium discoideum AX4]|eukprot:XP_629087.1 hypothetical protein DDB_G0293670 [Dictyostelium discoideum AX4]